MNFVLVAGFDKFPTPKAPSSRVKSRPQPQLLTGGGQNVSTDVKGNITLVPAALRSGTSSLALTWDFDNRLSTADVGNDASIDVTYRFDALGRRVYRDDGTTAIVYVPSGQQTIADYVAGTAATSPTYRYVYDSYIDEPVLRYKPVGTESLYYHRNQQYSVTAVTDGTGTIVERYAYSAYGVPTIANASGTVLTSSAHDNRYLYTGREWDEDLDLDHYRARMYDPELGRFCSRDPIGFPDGPSSYRAYFQGSALDPLGTVCTSINVAPPGFPGTGGMGTFGGSKGQIGPVGWDVDVDLRIFGEACDAECACDRNTIDYEVGLELSVRGELFVASYGGSYEDHFIRASYWLGGKVSGGIYGSASCSYRTDNCNCPGAWLGQCCFEIGGTVAVSLGGEGSFSIKTPWWVPISPLKNARMSLYGEMRGYMTYKNCNRCSCQGCKRTAQMCLRGELTVNASIIGSVGKTLTGYGASWTVFSGETCKDL